MREKKRGRQDWGFETNNMCQFQLSNKVSREFEDSLAEVLHALIGGLMQDVHEEKKNLIACSSEHNFRSYSLCSPNLGWTRTNGTVADFQAF
jgi:hypothetical protein